MSDLPDGRPAAVDAAVDDPPHEASTAVVVRAAPIATRPRWSDRMATAAARLPELARNPAVLATVALTASVAGEVAVGLLRRAVGASVAPGATMHVTGVVVHRVHVVHHHVVHVAPSQVT